MIQGPWQVTRHGGQGWVYEDPPVGIVPVPRKASLPWRRTSTAPPRAVCRSEGAIASSYTWSEIVQVLLVHSDIS